MKGFKAASLDSALVLTALVLALGLSCTTPGQKQAPAAQSSPPSQVPQQPTGVPRVEGQLWGQRVKLADDVHAPRLALSPDGSKIAYVTVPSPPPSTLPLLTGVPVPSRQQASLVILDAITGKPLYREDDTAADYFLMDWSPDNATLAYVSYSGRIVTIRFEGTGRRELVPPDLFERITTLAWSPDGRRIAFTSKNTLDRFSESFLWVMNRDGTNLQKLLGGPIEDVGRLAGKPTGVLLDVMWHPDGSKLLFGAGFASRPNALEAGESMLFTIPPGGGTPVPMPPPFTERRKMVFSPDGQKILYLRMLSEPEKPGFWLWTAKADGTSAASLSIGGKGVGSLDPVGWSPDGTKVVYVLGLVAPRTQGLWAADADGKNAVELVARAPGDYIATASMSRDGRTLAFAKLDKGGKTELWVAR